MDLKESAWFWEQSYCRFIILILKNSVRCSTPKTPGLIGQQKAGFSWFLEHFFSFKIILRQKKVLSYISKKNWVYLFTSEGLKYKYEIRTCRHQPLGY